MNTFTPPTPTSPHGATPAPSAAVWLRAIRAPSLSATFAPCLATFLLGSLQGWVVAPVMALFAVLGVLAVQIGVNLMNDVEDDRRGIDLPGTLGGSGVIQTGEISARLMARVAWGAFAVGLALGVPPMIAEPRLLAVVALAALGAWGYSGGPGLKYRALGDLAVIALCGPVLTAGFALAAFGTFDGLVLALGAALGFAAVGLLHVNNFQDMEDDARTGTRTVALQLGNQGSRAYLVALYVLAIASFPGFAALSGLPLPAVLAPLLAVVPAFALVRRILRASAAGAAGLRSPELALVRLDAAKAHLALGGLTSLGLLISLSL